MGHVESGGAAEDAGKLSERSAWPLWREVRKGFGFWSPLAERQGMESATAFSGDYVSGLRRSRAAARTFILLDAQPDLAPVVAGLGALNLTRAEHMFRFVALLYVSVPVTLVLGLAEVTPDGLLGAYRTYDAAIWYLIAALTFAVVFHMYAVWRARRLTDVLELWRIERTVEHMPESASGKIRRSGRRSH